MERRISDGSEVEKESNGKRRADCLRQWREWI
jgi:hypothetical protein